MLSRLKLTLAVAAIPACAVLFAGDATAVLVQELIEQGGDIRVEQSGSLAGISSAFVITGNNA
jgi:hypothetical protein